MTIAYQNELQKSMNPFFSNSHLVLEDILSESECEKLIKEIKVCGEKREAALYGNEGKPVQQNKNESKRMNTYLYDEEKVTNEYLLSTLTDFFELLSDVNNQTYKFSVLGVSQYLSLNVMKKGAKVLFHNDLSSVAGSAIKLVAVFSLSDNYKGGDFLTIGEKVSGSDHLSMDTYITRTRIPMGGCVVMPGYTMHAVDEVLSGERNSLVVSLEGVPYR